MQPMQLLRRASRGPRRAFNRALLPLLERSQQGFAGRVADRIRAARNAEIDNPPLDYWRFPDARLEAFNPIETARVLAFLKAHTHDVDRAAASFADEVSRTLYTDLWAYRALGPKHISLPKANPAYLSLFQRARDMRIADSPFVFPPFAVDRYRTSAITVDCWLGNIIAGLEKQYWFDRDSVTIEPEPGDVVIDAGACFGDTALSFADAVGPDGQVHAFEPLCSQREILSHNLKANPGLGGRITVHPFALSDVSGQQLFFCAGAGGHQADSGEPVETLAIDDLAFQRVDYIKLDIEGGETACLKGAVQAIRRFKPKLGISIYHSLDDMIALPLLVREIEPSYELYLDHHTIYGEESVLYATSGR